MVGILKNFNTIEEFKNSDKQALFNSHADQVAVTLFNSVTRREKLTRRFSGLVMEFPWTSWTYQPTCTLIFGHHFCRFEEI